jgi:hypothetical protein
MSCRIPCGLRRRPQQRPRRAVFLRYCWEVRRVPEPVEHAVVADRLAEKRVAGVPERDVLADPIRGRPRDVVRAALDTKSATFPATERSNCWR